MLRALNLVSDFIEEPKKAAQAAREKPLLGLAFAGYLIGALSLFLAKAITGRFILFGVSPVSLILECLCHLAAAVVLCAILHLIAEAWSGGGRATGLFVLLGLSDLGWALALPGALILRALAPGSRWGATALFVVVWLLTLRLKARSISHNYKIDRARAWITLALPYAAVAGLVLVAFSLAIFGAASHVLKLAR